jgi:two-component system LytT family response regulator
MNSTLPKQIRVLVVDDEPPARLRLVDLLRKDSEVSDIFVAEDGVTAVDMIQGELPSIVFLDVQMPDLDGFGVIEAVGNEQMPLTVFVTAYDRHAIRAFEADALDYLLKPFSDERFAMTIARAKSRLEDGGIRKFGQQVMQMISRLAVTHRRWDRLVVKTDGITRFVRMNDIDWIEAAGVYVNLHMGGKELLYRVTLQDMVEKLDPMRFVRVHRSTIINVESIIELEPISHGEFEVLLKDGSRPRVSRSYRAELEKRLGQFL